VLFSSKKKKHNTLHKIKKLSKNKSAGEITSTYQHKN